MTKKAQKRPLHDLKPLYSLAGLYESLKFYFKWRLTLYLGVRFILNAQLALPPRLVGKLQTLH